MWYEEQHCRPQHIFCHKWALRINTYVFMSQHSTTLKPDAVSGIDNVVNARCISDAIVTLGVPFERKLCWFQFT